MKKDKKNELPIIKTSMVEINGRLYEECYSPELKKAYFYSLLPSGDYEYTDIIETEDVIYEPINDDAITSGAVLLPSRPENFNSVKELIDEIKNFIHKYLDISEEHELFSSYYVLLSWVYDRFTVLPYLRALGDTGTGKSRYLTVIGSLLYKPCIVSGAVTPAPLYRLIKKWRGSMIIDEADFKNGSETTNDIIKILNCGFEINKPVIRCDKDDPDDLQFLPTFSPKIIATRYSFRDKALESRCLTEKMKQTTRKDIPPILPKSFFDESNKLRNKLLAFRFSFRNIVNPEIIQNIDLGEIEPRLKQGMSAFSVLFFNIPEVFEQFKIFLGKYQTELIEERSSSFEGMIISALYELSETENKKQISAQDIADKMNTLYNPEKSYEARSIGHYLKSLGIQTKKVRIGQETKRLIIYDVDLFKSLFARYIVPSVPLFHVFHDYRESPKNGTEKIKTPSVPFVPWNYTNLTFEKNNKRQNYDVPNDEALPYRNGTNGTMEQTEQNESIVLKCPVCSSRFYDGVICQKCIIRSDSNQNQ